MPEKVAETGSTHYGDDQLLSVSVLHKDGHQLSIEFSIQLLKEDNGRIEWVVAIIRDVTDHFIRDKALRARVKRLEG